MAYQCPRCGDKVSRSYSTTAQMAGGLVGALFVGAFGSFGCKKCGKIPRAEFPADVQNKMMLGSLGMVAGAVVLFVVVLVAIVALNTK
jgi:predicted RNA-binding Zn-ribbon protein involved in translation (DUF1610 family)